MKKNMKKILLITITLIIPILLTGCGTKEEPVKENLLGIDYTNEGNTISLDKYKTENPVVAMYVKNYGSIVMELYPDTAPNTVNNFISLVKSGFYDNNTFHRLIPGFVLQGGDPTGTGTGGPKYTIKGEFKNNGYKNELKHEERVVSMARTGNSYDSAGSQFFIMLGKSDYLDGDYAAFGKVIAGWDNVKNIVNNEVIADQESGQLQNNLKIVKSVIDLKGKEYDEVKKISE